jgi:hypothetical protein
MVASFLATQALDLNDFGSQAGEHLSAPGSCLMAPQIDYADTVQRSFDICHMRHSLGMAIAGVKFDSIVPE